VRVPSVSSMIRACRAAWGEDLFAYLLGAGLNGPLAGWKADARSLDAGTLARLRASFDLQRLFPDTGRARAWIRNRHPELGNLSPARLIRRGSSDGLTRVLELAERESRKLVIL
jgi:hypothetical protein